MLVRVGQLSQDTTSHHERKMMATHVERPGKGVMFWEETHKRKSEKGPDYKGFIVLEMDYKAGDKVQLSAWQKETGRGYYLLSLSEDNWARKQKETPIEVRSGYQRRDNDFARKARDEDIPF
jgi:hypothetical protein